MQVMTILGYSQNTYTILAENIHLKGRIQKMEATKSIESMCSDYSIKLDSVYSQPTIGSKIVGQYYLVDYFDSIDQYLGELIDCEIQIVRMTRKVNPFEQRPVEENPVDNSFSCTLIRIVKISD